LNILMNAIHLSMAILGVSQFAIILNSGKQFVSNLRYAPIK
jgi:hypothetical protein